jgi:predicted outer membrane lipoprotein
MKRRLQWIFGTLVAVAFLALGAFWLRPVEFFEKQTELRLLLSGAESHTIALPIYRVRVHYYVPLSCLCMV